MTWRTCRSTATANVRHSSTALLACALALARPALADACLACSALAVSANEIQALFARFRALDRRHKGYIGADELLSVPELAINPLAQRLVQLLGACNFKDFVALLSAFSTRASREGEGEGREAALRLMFSVHDVDGDGVISRADLLTVARARAGTTLSDEQLAELIDRALPPAAPPLDFAAFCQEFTTPAAAGGTAQPLLTVNVPCTY